MLLRFLLVAGVSTWSVFHSVPVGAAEKSKSHPQRLANGPAGNYQPLGRCFVGSGLRACREVVPPPRFLSD